MFAWQQVRRTLAAPFCGSCTSAGTIPGNFNQAESQDPGNRRAARAGTRFSPHPKATGFASVWRDPSQASPVCSRMFAVLKLALLAAFVLAMPVMASTSYTYTGNDFTTITCVGNCPGPAYSTSDFISGSFTLSSPLAPNLDEVSIFPSSFTFTDGPDTFTSGDPLISVCNCSPSFSNFSTDASGNITAWNIMLTLGELGAASLTTVDANLGVIRGLTVDDSANFSDNTPDGFTGQNAASNIHDAGTWTVGNTSAAPEPGGLILLVTGLAGIAGGLRRRSRL
jgi:hypothetical protein